MTKLALRVEFAGNTKLAIKPPRSLRSPRLIFIHVLVA